MSYTSDIAKPILNILQKLDRPTEVEELAFRLRSTPSVVREELEKLEEAKLVQKENGGYSIVSSARSSSLESLFSY
ncbi:MAG TPA: ArsR family transcriptional regulator, partial [Puia sp.]|nr:ArsR family transcriptional regulator [Puia sp.]